jgi:hypothetical protein
MRVDRVEHAQREGANGCLRRRADHGRVHRAGDDGIAGGGQQLALVGDVPVNGTRTGGEPFGQGAECQTAFSAVVQERDRRLNDAIP